jgi:SMI1-KNR4 cell-wall
MQKLEKLLASMSFEQSGPVGTADIRSHEQNLGLKFGPNYKLFLSKYGCVVAGPNELYGVCGDNASIPSAIHATLSARRDPRFPRNLLVIGNDGSGRKYCVDSYDNVFVCDRNTCVKSGQSFENFAVEWVGA